MIPSRSTDLDVLGRLLTTITDNLIFDRLTVIERTKAGTFDSRDMDEHVSAVVLGLNKSIALRRVEPFDSAGSQLLPVRSPAKACKPFLVSDLKM